MKVHVAQYYMKMSREYLQQVNILSLTWAKYFQSFMPRHRMRAK